MPFTSHRSPCEGVLCCAACDAPRGAWPRRCCDRSCQCFWQRYRSSCFGGWCHHWWYSRWRSPHCAFHLLGDAVPHLQGLERRRSCSHLGPPTVFQWVTRKGILAWTTFTCNSRECKVDVLMSATDSWENPLYHSSGFHVNAVQARSPCTYVPWEH